MFRLAQYLLTELQGQSDMNNDSNKLHLSMLVGVGGLRVFNV